MRAESAKGVSLRMDFVPQLIRGSEEALFLQWAQSRARPPTMGFRLEITALNVFW